jgi:NAD(P)-dependent dehydrogenase (short-subunit alcohol dehydrogenase family)
METVQDLDGRTAVITGGASGIGLATARLLASEGMRLVLADVEAEPLARAAAELGALGVHCDVTDLHSMQHLADQAFDTFGAVHIVFNNAGVALEGPIVEMTHADWQWTLDVNLWGPIHGVEAFLARMIRHGEGGHLIFTSSFAGLVANLGLGPYCVSKYGVVALAEVLQKELRDLGIGVSVICPMRVDTKIFDSSRNRPESLGGPAASAPVPGRDADAPGLAGQVLSVGTVATEIVAAIKANRLYVLPHAESLAFVRGRFARIERDATS